MPVDKSSEPGQIMTPRLKRSISSKGQVRIPRDQRDGVDGFLIPEPGTVSPDDEIWMFPSNRQHELRVDGEVLRRSTTDQGHITLPSDFRKLTGMTAGMEVFVERDEYNDTWIIRLTLAD